MKDENDMSVSTDQLIAMLERERAGGDLDALLGEAGFAGTEAEEMRAYLALSRRLNAESAKIDVPETFMEKLLKKIPDGGGISEQIPSYTGFSRAMRSPWTFGAPIMVALLAFVIITHNDPQTPAPQPVVPLAMKQGFVTERFAAPDTSASGQENATEMSTFAALAPSESRSPENAGPVASAKTFAAPELGSDAEPKSADEIVLLLQSEAGVDSAVGADSDQLYLSLTSDTASLNELEQAYDESDL